MKRQLGVEVGLPSGDKDISTKKTKGPVEVPSSHWTSSCGGRQHLKPQIPPSSPDPLPRALTRPLYTPKAVSGGSRR